MLRSRLARQPPSSCPQKTARSARKAARAAAAAQAVRKKCSLAARAAAWLCKGVSGSSFYAELSPCSARLSSEGLAYERGRVERTVQICAHKCRDKDGRKRTRWYALGPTLIGYVRCTHLAPSSFQKASFVRQCSAARSSRAKPTRPSAWRCLPLACSPARKATRCHEERTASQHQLASSRCCAAAGGWQLSGACRRKIDLQFGERTNNTENERKRGRERPSKETCGRQTTNFSA